MKASSTTCRNCGSSGFYSRTIHFREGTGCLLPPPDLFHPVECRVRVCRDCGLVEWYVTEESLEKLQWKYDKEG